MKKDIARKPSAQRLADDEFLVMACESVDVTSIHCAFLWQISLTLSLFPSLPPLQDKATVLTTERKKVSPPRAGPRADLEELVVPLGGEGVAN